jgi:hypothetical protein
LLLLTSASSLVACGATTRDDNSGSRDIDGVALIDNGEDGNNTVLEDELKYVGYWYTYDDKMECDNDNPTGETMPLPAPSGGDEFTMTAYAAVGQMGPPEDVPPGNAYGIRLKGGGHNLWGAGVGVGLNNQSGALTPFDLTAAGVTGVRFWIKNAVPGSPIDVNVRISDKYSDPGQGLCIPRDEETCSTQGCHDSPTATVEGVTDEWTLKELPLSMFKREGWGLHEEGVTAPTDLDPTAAIQLQFAVPVADQFEIWIDNVGFILANGG